MGALVCEIGATEIMKWEQVGWEANGWGEGVRVAQWCGKGGKCPSLDGKDQSRAKVA